VHPFRTFISFALATLVAGTLTASAQESLYERFRGHNAAMAEVQPSWMGPLVQSDSRLTQAMRISYSNAYAPGAQVMSFGNNHGFSLLAARRFQFDLNPPSFFRNHSALLKDGWGNAATQVKYRIASGNADHGNYALTGIVTRSFTPGSQQNAALTGAYNTRVAAGRAWGPFNLQTTFGAVLPTGKVDAQGRIIEWNVTGQAHPNPHVWLDVEDNAAWIKGGPLDGEAQNFLTPAAFYMIKRRDWQPTHGVVVFNAGMQIATSRFHLYNHNLIAEMRVLF